MIEQFFSDNEVFSGGFVLMLLGSMIAMCRRLPGLAWQFIARQFSVTVEIRNDDVFFNYFEAWINAKKGNKLRDVVISQDLSVTPAPGFHIIRHSGKFIRIFRVYESSNNGSLRAREKFVLCFLFCRNLKVAQGVMEEIQKEATLNQKKYFNMYMGEKYFNVRKRALSTVILDPDQKDDIVSDVTKFLMSKEWYDERGIPWRRGYLLHGPPGNGKTSFVRAVASEFNMDMKVIQLGSMLGDAQLCVMMSTESPEIILIEDIDAYKFAKDADQAQPQPNQSDDKISLLGGVTKSGLLNAIDGVTPSEGRLLFITTNHPEELEPALMRPGRVDREILIDNASPQQAEEMFRRFFPSKNGEAAEFAKLADGSRSMAELQNMLLRKE